MCSVKQLSIEMTVEGRLEASENALRLGWMNVPSNNREQMISVLSKVILPQFETTIGKVRTCRLYNGLKCRCQWGQSHDPNSNSNTILTQSVLTLFYPLYNPQIYILADTASNTASNTMFRCLWLYLQHSAMCYVSYFFLHFATFKVFLVSTNSSDMNTVGQRSYSYSCEYDDVDKL